MQIDTASAQGVWIQCRSKDMSIAATMLGNPSLFAANGHPLDLAYQANKEISTQTESALDNWDKHQYTQGN